MKRQWTAAAMLALLLCACASESPGGSTLRGRDEQAAGCPAERAIYALRSVQGPELRLVRFAGLAASDLALQVSIDGTDFWYWLTESHGYGSISATLGPNPTDDVEDPDQFEADAIDTGPFTAFTASFDVIPRAPRAGDPAPAHLFAPDMGVSIWFETSASESRTFLPVAMWDFTRCAPPESE